jgi:hypothetical protein
MTHKSVSTNYFIQTNDAFTAAKIADKKILHHRAIKNYPVETLGNAGGLAWIFMNEVMAFDPFTLEQKAGLAILEEKNPSLKSKFPDERRYYYFDQTSGNIFFTAKDGSGWQLDTKSLQASAGEFDATGSPAKKEIARLEKLLKLNSNRQDSLVEQRMRRPSRMLAAGKISRIEYNRLSIGLNDERSRLYRERDSLRATKSIVEKVERSSDETNRKIAALQEQNSIHFSQLKVNADTTKGQWYGLYSGREIDKLRDRFQYNAVYDETARRQLYSSSISINENGDWLIARESAEANGSNYFLDGGLLLDKQKGKPIQLEGSSFLIVHKGEVGNGGKIQLSLVNIQGKVTWSFDSQLKEWANYIFTGKQLFIIGTNNKKLSSSDCNIFWCVDLATGMANSYDYFYGQ